MTAAFAERHVFADKGEWSVKRFCLSCSIELSAVVLTQLPKGEYFSTLRSKCTCIFSMGISCA